MTNEEYVAKSILKKELNITNLHQGIVSALQNIIDEIPAADVQKVKHGRWIAHIDTGSVIYECSECDNEFEMYNGTQIAEIHYCPNCGAKMDGKAANDV